MSDTQKTVTIATKWKDDGLGNLEREIRKTGDGFSELKRQVKAADGTVTSSVTKMRSQVSAFSKTMSGLRGGMEGVQKSVTGLFTKFLAFEAIKKVFKGLFDSWKAFDEATGGENVKKLQTIFSDLQMQIGSVLAPTMESLITWFEKNRDVIMQVAGVITNVLVEAFKLLYNTVMLIAAAIDTAIAGLVTGISWYVKQILGNINLLIKYIPGIPQSWKDAMQGAEDAVENFTNISAEATKGLALETAKYAKDIGGNFKKAFSIPKVTSVKASSAKERIANEKISEKELAAFKKAIQASDILYLQVIEEMAQDNFKNEMKRAVTINGYHEKTLSEMQKSAREGVGPVATVVAQRELERRILKDINDLSAENNVLTEKHLEQLIAQNIEAISIKRYKEVMQESIDIRMKDFEDYKDKLIEKQNFEEERVDAEIKIQTELRDIAISSVKDKLEQIKLIVRASYNEQEQALFESLDNGLITTEEYTMAVMSLEDQRLLKIKSVEDEIKAARRQSIQEQIEGYAQAGDMIMGIVSNVRSAQIEAIDSEASKKKEYVEANIKGEKTKAREMAKIDKQAEKEKKKIQKAQMADDLIMAIANTALGITRALTLTPPLSYVMAALTLAAGAIQIGIISSQMGKLASGGIVPGQGQKDSKGYMLSPGEAVLNTDQQRRFMAIANGQVAAGGTATISSNDTIIVQGNLDMAAADKIRADRETQLTMLADNMRELTYRSRLRDSNNQPIMVR